MGKFLDLARVEKVVTIKVTGVPIVPGAVGHTHIYIVTYMLVDYL